MGRINKLCINERVKSNRNGANKRETGGANKLITNRVDKSCTSKANKIKSQ